MGRAHACIPRAGLGRGARARSGPRPHCPSDAFPDAGAILASSEAAYNHCTQCVNLILNGSGILPAGWGDPYNPNQVPIPTYQFGKCVAEGQLIRAIVKGEEKPTGVHSLCFDAEDKYSRVS